jgi:predicted alpha-1,2-mannosidase
VRAAADAQWQRLLSRIEIDADARFKTIFYSALYRTLLHPSDIADADGRVRGPTGQVMAAPGGVYYSTLSPWDTFRGVHPLLTLLVPERVPGFIQTMLAHHRAQGYLPLWTAWGRETHTMIGNPALPVIADAVAKGLHRRDTGFDLQAALQAMVETSTLPRPQAPEWAQRSWDDYERFGFIPLDRIGTESVSKTLELGIGDDAVARVARAADRPDVAERFARRARGWRQLWDAQTQTMRGRDSAGRWREPFDPLVPTSPMNNPGDYTEANAWQYTLTPALHDPAGLVAQMGGAAAFEAWLDRFFSLRAPGDNKHLGQETMIGQYAHGNEPSHHIAYLYAWTASPGKGQALIRRIVHGFYGSGPDGIIGNDDCGQMSAWLVLSTLGFYPVVPASGTYVAVAKLVRRAALARADGARLVIVPGQRPGVWLDGLRVDSRALPHAALLQARRLEVGPAR